jgi:SHS2 domain-containing protein
MPQQDDYRLNEDASWFREFEHTGDVGIELNAPTRCELFRRACIGLASLLVDKAGVEAVAQRKVEVSAATDADLMHDLLTELLCLFTVEGFIWRDASVKEADRSLQVTLNGERFDPNRHSFRGEIKAVTYHQLIVASSANGWRARVIFDV